LDRKRLLWDPARRCGMKTYISACQGNVELLKEMGIKKIITTCPHATIH
jgi:Fe-S oxidoreductase